MSKISEVINCGNKLYYDINPKTKMDVPSYFYMRLEKEYDLWISDKSTITFYDYCLNKVRNKA